MYGVANLNHTKANGYKDGGERDTDWKYSRFNQALVLGSCRLKPGIPPHLPTRRHQQRPPTAVRQRRIGSERHIAKT